MLKIQTGTVFECCYNNINDNIMATKEQHGKSSPMRKGGQSQHSKAGKESRNSMTANNNSMATGMEQQESSNKGKGPAGENL